MLSYAAIFRLCVLFILIVIILLIVYSPPRFVISLFSKFYADVLFHIEIPSDIRAIALTIDDFPNLGNLTVSFRILDLLRMYNVRCTFFTIGSHVEKYKNSPQIRALFERLIAEGHELGNHGWRDEQAIRLSQQELKQQIVNTQNVMNNYAPSISTKWFRPGSGFFNRTMIQLCKDLDYRLVLGSIYPHDPQIPHARLNSFFIEHKLYPGAIVILHDRQATIATLTRVLPAIVRRGFQIVTLTELSAMKRSSGSLMENQTAS